MARVHRAREIGPDLRVAIEPPVGEHPDEIALERRRIALLDDQRTGQAAAELLAVTEVRVIPVRTGIGQIELVKKAAAVTRDRRLGQAGDAVHRIGEPDAVPMDGRLDAEAVLYFQPQAFPLLETQLRSGHRAV